MQGAAGAHATTEYAGCHSQRSPTQRLGGWGEAERGAAYAAVATGNQKAGGWRNNRGADRIPMKSAGRQSRRSALNVTALGARMATRGSVTSGGGREAAHLRLEVDLVRWQLRANCSVPRSGHLMSGRRRQRRQWQLRCRLQPPSPLVADPKGLHFERRHRR